jgi:GAF domain-containing protein
MPRARSPSEIKTRRILESHDLVFERIARGAGLDEVLRILASTSERVVPDVLCSILVLDPATQRLFHGAAPSLDETYLRAIDGGEIGPCHGSCGTAAYTGQRVIVEDVVSHPYWADYWQLAVAAGLRACWSEPILSSKGQVLGTFAMYYREPRKPDAFDLDFIHSSAHVAGIAIERARVEVELEQHRSHLEELVRERTAELERVNRELRQALVDVKVLRGMLPICASCKRVRDDGGYWEQIEAYVTQRSEAEFTHGICPECVVRLYPDRPSRSSD